MPLQIYNKEQILDACLAVFARHGYKNTTAAMLAEAAGIFLCHDALWHPTLIGLQGGLHWTLSTEY